MFTSLFLIENNYLLGVHKINLDTNQIHRSLLSAVNGKCVITIAALPFLYFLVVLPSHLQRTRKIYDSTYTPNAGISNTMIADRRCWICCLVVEMGEELVALLFQLAAADMKP